MNPDTGEIFEGSEEDIKKLEKKLDRELVRLPEDRVEDIRGLTQSERISVAKSIRRRRAKNRSARKARRRNRK